VPEAEAEVVWEDADGVPAELPDDVGE